MTAAVPAAPQPPDAEDLNAGRPAVWSGAVAPGGMVCAVPDDLTADGICGNPVESEPCNRHDGEPAAPARSLTAPDVVAGLLADVAESRAQLTDAAPELAAAMAETRTIRDGYASLCKEFGPSPQSGWSARISMTILNRHRSNAGLDQFSRTESNQREDILLRYRRERDEYAELLVAGDAERIALQRDRDKLTAQLAARDKALEALDRVVTSHARSMYAAHIDVRHGDPGDADPILSEALDGFDGPQWNGTETGIQWLERTREADGG